MGDKIHWTATPEHLEMIEGYKELQREKFRGVYAHITAIADVQNGVNEKILESLLRIEGHTEKTNGSVARANKDIALLKLQDIEHILKCPQKPRVDMIEKNMMEYNFIKKHPKLILYSVVGLVLMNIIIILVKLIPYLMS